MTGAAHLEFARRAAELRIDCWSVDPHFSVFAFAEPPQDPAGVAEVIAVARAARAAGEPIRQARGRYDLFALPDTHGVVVADLAVGGTTFDREHIARVLTHYHQDLSRSASNALSIEGFNQQLSQSYEEVNLIFRMAKLLTSSSEPRQVVQTMCDELRGTLNYGWLALAFRADEAVLSPLRGAVLHAGELPWTTGELAEQVATLDVAKVGRVLTPADHPMATRAGSELLAEQVLHGDSPIGLLVAGGRQGVDPEVSSNEVQLVQAAAGFLGLFHQNAFRFAQQRQQFLGTLHALSAAVEAKDPYTQGHSERVGWLASQLGAKIGFDPIKVEATRVAGLLHDIGKIGVPETVIRKPGGLTDAEFALIKQHPEIGHGMLKNLPSLAFHLPGVLHHHERYDGRGYPHQLRGDEIPLIARLIALADTFDAMSSNRAYRPAMNRSWVLQEIRKSAGTQFDPALVEPFVTLDFATFDAMLDARRSDTPLVETKAA